MDLPLLDIPYEWNHVKYVPLCIWFLSLSVFSGFMHVVAHSSTSFLFITTHYSIELLYHILFICSWVDGHLSHFHSSAVVNNAALRIHVQVFVWTYVLIYCQYIPRSAYLRHMVTMFNLLRSHQNCFPKWSHNFIIPPSNE